MCIRLGFIISVNVMEIYAEGHGKSDVNSHFLHANELKKETAVIKMSASSHH